MYYFAAKNTEYSGPQKANMILNGTGGTYYSSHNTINLNAGELFKWFWEWFGMFEDLIQMPNSNGDNIDNNDFKKIKAFVYRHNILNIYIWNVVSTYVERKIPKKKIL